MNEKPGTTIRIAAMGDLHVREQSDFRYRDLFKEMENKSDVILLCGDLTDSGTRVEAGRLAGDLAGIKVPVMGVLGNHDHADGRPDEIKKILSDAGVVFLEGRTNEVNGTGFVGAKGFGGGFGRYMLASFGESAVKRFVDESVRESLELETGLRNLQTRNKIAMLHYAPTASTVHGEPPEVYPFLGSSRLAEVIERFGVKAVFHAHAHFGTFEGALRGGARVYNCSRDVVHRATGKFYALIAV